MPMHVEASRIRPRPRPRLHFTANCWINDPCAPAYDVRTETYQLFYQCNPSSTEWGNMSWGRAISKDMLTWVPASDTPALVPDQLYDQEGVFTGCWLPSADPNDHYLRVIYSSVRGLPFHWSTPPYPREAAGLAMAFSDDGGLSWTKSGKNPILRGEPSAVHVTGFRDPYVAPWPSMDQALGKNVPALYGVVSGGIQDQGPTSFLYEISGEDFSDWKYLGPLLEMPLRFQPSAKWSGNYGVNWECVNFMTLRSGSYSRDFLIIGAEGDVEKEHVANHRVPQGLSARTIRAQLWMSGSLRKDDQGNLLFQYHSGGYLDHGPYYAANSFIDPASERRIVHGWIPEEDATSGFARRKGWNGSLAIPRELFLLRIPHVQHALHSELSDLASFERKIERDGSLTLFTLGVKPISEVANLREGCQHTVEIESSFTLPRSANNTTRSLSKAISSTWEIEATMAIQSGCETVGFHIQHEDNNANRASGWRVYFSVLDETIVVDRSDSTTDKTVNTCPEAGPFTLFTTMDVPRSSSGKSTGIPRMEKLQLRLISDGDILEVFANDRFALTTMVYPERHEQTRTTITAFANGASDSVVFERFCFWDGLQSKSSDDAIV